MEEIQQERGRTAGHGYLVPQVGSRGDPRRAVNHWGQLLEVGHHAAAARVEGDGDVHSVRRLQAPAHHIHKLKHRGNGWKRVPMASLAIVELCRAERAVGQPTYFKGFPPVSPLVSDSSEGAHSHSAPTWPTATRNSQRVVTRCTWDLSL